MDEIGTTRAFATVLHGWQVEERDVLDAALLMLIDGIAVTAAGIHEGGPMIMAEMARREQAAPIATVIGHGFATSAALAARTNGVAMHVLDFEPMWNPPNHALSPMLPSVLAVAERAERGGAAPQGAKVLRAIAKGVEAQGRLRVSSGQIEPHALRFHPPGVVGPLATAAACSDLLGLDMEGMATAMAIAASSGAGIIGNIGTMTKAMHCGNAAMRGLEAADLAAAGFTADRDAIGNPRGYGRAYFGDGFDPAPLTAPLKVARLIEPGPAWKLFPSQYGTHFTITAALDARSAIKDPTQIRAVRLTTPEMAYVDRPRPESGLAGKFSFQFGVAAALLDGKVDMDSFTDQRRFAPDMEAMLGRITLTQDPSISGRLDRMHVDIVVEMADGTVVERRCNAPDGSWTRRVPGERIREKARSLLSRCLPDAAQRGFWSLIDRPAAEIPIAALMATVAKTV